MRLLDRRDDRKFGEDLRSHLVSFFAMHSAQVVENDESEYREPRSFDYAVATISTPDLDLRFVRMRGEFEINISCPVPHRRWDALDSALLWLDMQRGTANRPEIPSWGYGYDWSTLDWRSIDQFLIANWDRLKAAAAARPYLNHQ